jgi:hypothetical protein
MPRFARSAVTITRPDPLEDPAELKPSALAPCVETPHHAL